MTSIPEHQLTILAVLIEHYDEPPREMRRRLVHHRTFDGEEFHSWPEDGPYVGRDDLEELADLGLIDIEFGNGSTLAVRPTTEGRETIQLLNREKRRAESAEPVNLAWSVVRPLLHAIVETWAAEGAPTEGFVQLEAAAQHCDPRPSDLWLARVAEQLDRADWIVLTYAADQDTDLPYVRPTTRGVIAANGWPGGDGDVAAERLLAALDELAESSDETKRTWAARARDTLMEIGTKTLAEVAAKAAGGAM